MRSHALLFASLLLIGSDFAVDAADWPQWGAKNCRNMVSTETGLPEMFTPGRKSPTGLGIDPSTTRNVRWSARLGSNAYGNPTVADGRVYVGTDDLLVGEDPRFRRSKGGVVRCFDEATGEQLWQLVIPVRPKEDLPPNAHFMFQYLGVCSSPTIEGDRAYVVDNGGRVLCLDVHGQANGNDGPFTDESAFMSPHFRSPVKLQPTDGDIIWSYDLVKDLGICPHDAISNSVLIVGDLIYLSTNNGVDSPHEKAICPDAPTFIALDKNTGRLVATDDLHMSSSPRFYHTQWSSPSAGTVDGKTLVFFGGTDGICYAFEALDRVPDQPVKLVKAWSYDCNPYNYRYRENGQLIPYYEGDKRKNWSTNDNDGKYLGPSQIIATPVFYENKVYIAIGQDPAHGRGRGLLHCINASGSGDITESGCVWTYDALDRTMATVAIHDGLLYAADVAGRIHCVDAETGKPYWQFETDAETWGGVLVADGKLYIGNKREFLILAEGKEAKLINKIRLGTPAYSTPVTANGVLYVASSRFLWAVTEEK